MGFPFQISDAELKKSSKKRDDEDEENSTEEQPKSDQGPQNGSEGQEQPSFPAGPKPEKPEPEAEICEIPPEPDFCGLFQRALEPFCPPPAVSVNININLGGDPCQQQEPPKQEPQVISFARGKDQTNA